MKRLLIIAVAAFLMTGCGGSSDSSGGGGDYAPRTSFEFLNEFNEVITSAGYSARADGSFTGRDVEFGNTPVSGSWVYERQSGTQARLTLNYNPFFYPGNRVRSNVRRIFDTTFNSATTGTVTESWYEGSTFLGSRTLGDFEL